MRRVSIRIFEALVVACMGGMVVLVFGNVVLRYVFNAGISISEELSRMMFVWMTFIGAIIAMAEGTHLGLDSVVTRLPHAGRVVCALLSDIAIVVCCVLLGQGAWEQTLVNMGNVAPVSGIPLGYVHVAVLVASVGIVLVASGQTWRLLTGRATARDLIQVSESAEHVPDDAGTLGGAGAAAATGAGTSAATRASAPTDSRGPR